MTDKENEPQKSTKCAKEFFFVSFVIFCGHKN
jgi:hypothetical protein